MIQVLDSLARLEDELAPWRSTARRVGLVPTMGALHSGHLSLIERAVADCEAVAVSIFVNPTQFGPGEDFERYPRHLELDLAMIEKAGATWCFVPSAEEMYPTSPPEVTVDPGALGEILEGSARPGHFRGVATVVAKLFALFAPAAAYFGEKDYQQLAIVRRLARDLSLRVEVVGCPTVRQPDGLAESSRNRRLSPAERRAAPVLYEALSAGAAAAATKKSTAEIEAVMAGVIGGEPLAQLDYAVARDPASLGLVADDAPELRLLLAVSFGDVRLIDNLLASR